MQSRNRKLIYLAGPDVFYPDAEARGEDMVRLCAEYGHIGSFPLDSASTTSDASRAQKIYWDNIDRINRCDVVLANLNPFRGFEPDSGTAFEVGYAVARGKPVYGYLRDTRPLVEKFEGRLDAEGCGVEDFGLAVNLMLGVPVVLVSGGCEDALRWLNLTLARAGMLGLGVAGAESGDQAVRRVPAHAEVAL